MKTNKRSQFDKLSTRAIIVWFVSGLFSCFQFCAQVIPGPMTMEIMQAYELNAVSISYAVSSFFYMYLLMQLPAGLILDRYSSRYLLPITCLICAIGSAGMGLADNGYTFALARIICAFGASFGFIGAMRVLRNYFPMHYIPLFIGLTETQGFLATSLCENLVSYYLPLLGFKKVLFNFGVTGVFLSMLVYLSLHPKVTPKNEYAPISKHDVAWKDVTELLVDKQIWLLGIISFGFFALVTSFAALWGVPSLISIQGLSVTESTQAISAIFLGIAFGGPVVGHLSNNPKRQKMLVFCCGLLCAVLLLTIIMVNNLGFMLTCALMFLLGAFSCCYLLCFAIGNEIVPAKLSGTCMGFINMITMASALILQPVMGYLVSLKGPIGVLNGAPIYAASGYRTACMSLVLIFFVVSFLSTMLKVTVKNRI